MKQYIFILNGIFIGMYKLGRMMPVVRMPVYIRDGQEWGEPPGDIQTINYEAEFWHVTVAVPPENNKAIELYVCDSERLYFREGRIWEKKKGRGKP